MKNCLVIIRNKKLNLSFELLNVLTDTFSASGYYFDKIAFVPFDSSQEITCQLKECKQIYNNTIILCSAEQVQVISDYLDKLYADGGRESAVVLSLSNLNAAKYQEIICSWNERFGLSYDKIYIKTIGAPTALINNALEEVHKINSDVSFTVNSNYGDCTTAITYSSQTPKMVADSVLRTFVTILDDYIYALENISIAQRLYQLLKLRRMKISVAESFTGGGICKKLVEVSGISEVFFEGLNTYSNQSKQERLGVKELTLKQCGAVSDETAYQMAEGLISSGNCDIAIATTGIAGPKSDNTEKPVGLAYISIGTKENISVYKFNFVGDRETITQTAINQALFLAYKRLK
jgi:nicotinamide-nucleotide amidase